MFNTTATTMTSEIPDSNCVLRMNELQSPATLIYSILSIFGGLGASLGNLLVLIIIWRPTQRTQSHKILTSLAISDMLVGVLLFPLFSAQLLSTDHLLQNCLYDYAREYITTVTIGSSLMGLGVVSYDRYILMTKYGQYKDIMTSRKITILVTISWGFPAVSPTLRFLGKGPFLYCVIAITLGPLIILLLTYYKIVKCIQRSSARIKSHAVQSLTTTTTTFTTSNRENNNKVGFLTPTSPRIHLQGRRVDLSTKRAERRNIKLAKTVSFLILVYCVCLVPSSVWAVCDIIQESVQFTRTKVIQNMYVFACFSGSMNSTFNPLIYFFKQPDMRKGFKKLFGFTSNRTTNNDISSSN